MGLTIDDVMSRLAGVKGSRGRWTALCPAHGDKTRSLAISVSARNGAPLLYCHAGCDYRDIIAALGVTAPITRRTSQQPCRLPPRPAQIFRNAIDAPLSLPGLELAHEWRYQSSDMSTAFLVYRLHDASGAKTIRPVTTCTGGWCWGPPAPLRPLYRLPKVLSSTGLVVITEGEKAADAVAAAGLVATTSVGGAAAARKSDWSVLAGREVLVWPDNDEPGAAYARDVANLLGCHGVRARCLPAVGGRGDDAADHSDVAGYVAAFSYKPRKGTKPW